jgi:hypothetical protein
VALHQLSAFLETGPGFLDARVQGLGVGEHDDGHAVAVVGAVADPAVVEDPGVAPGLGIAMRAVEEIKAIAGGVR